MAKMIPVLMLHAMSPATLPWISQILDQFRNSFHKKDANIGVNILNFTYCNN